MSLTSLKALGVSDIVLLFSRHNSKVPRYLSEKYNVEIHEYDDNRNDKSYIPSIKPYLWARYLEEDVSRQNDTYFYVDSDVIFRELPDVIPNDVIWYGSNCTSYLSVDYIDSKGEGLLEAMCQSIGIDSELIRSANPVAGAQWVIKNPTYEYWQKVYEDSNTLYRYLKSLKNNSIQKWTAEMWAQLWNVLHMGIQPAVHEDLDFSWATDDISRYYETKMYHNAGVIDDKQQLFFKGKYIHKSPFNDNLDFVRKDKASIKYVEALKAVVG